MNTFYKIFLLFILLIFLSTFNPLELNFSSTSNTSFFNIKSIEVENNTLVSKEKIINNLSNILDKNIFLLQKKEIKEPLKKINYLEKVDVKKIYPNKILIKVSETKPLAILLKNKKKFIIDSSSNLILVKEKDNFNDLPQVFGEGAEINFLYFINLLKKNNFPLREVKIYYYFQIGRWDIQFINDKILKLPYNNVDEAILKSTKLLEDKDFKNYNIIDLRVDGKIIVE
jgi:cell division septal protein FtsQ